MVTDGSLQAYKEYDVVLFVYLKIFFISNLYEDKSYFKMITLKQLLNEPFNNL